MEGIRDKVAIIGMGCTKFGELWDKGVGDLIIDAAYEAFEDAGLGPDDIQAAWIGTVFSGLSAITLAPLRLNYAPVTRVENMCATGSEALKSLLRKYPNKVPWKALVPDLVCTITCRREERPMVASNRLVMIWYWSIASSLRMA